MPDEENACGHQNAEECSKPGAHTQAKQRLASNPDAKPAVLEKLADRGNTDVTARVAENAQVPVSTLQKLATHNAHEVRSAVSKNPNTPGEVLDALAHDEHPDVRFELAGNANTPLEILESLKNDENPYIVDRAERTLKAVKSVLETADELLLQGSFEEAENHYRILISGLENLLGADHAEVASARHKLAAALAGQDKTDEAATVEQRANLTRDAIEATS